MEDTVHFAEEEIGQIVPALLAAGHHRCLALGALELPEPLPHAFEVSISADKLREFNAECGIFRFLIVPPDLSWTIRCNEWFNVFAGPASLVQRLIGIPIQQALEEFLAYARVVEQGQEGYLVQVARQYGA